jgi:hypothetical protein
MYKGAKRRICGYPGCLKHVKKSGMCSTHGPARKRCMVEGCEKVAVQGGKCVSHGAKKKSCSVDGCWKQATLFGMCKRHHDGLHGTSNPWVENGYENFQAPPSWPHAQQCVPIPSTVEDKERSHQRGLSVFHDMNTVETILSGTYASSDYAHTSTGTGRWNEENIRLVELKEVPEKTPSISV